MVGKVELNYYSSDASKVKELVGQNTESKNLIFVELLTASDALCSRSRSLGGLAFGSS